MQLKTLFACASFVAAAVAQISQDRIAFTVLPTAVQAGQPVKLQWGGGNGAPVTITLQKGQTTNLKTVEVITGDATGNSYTWTPSSSLANGEDYALKIEQGTQPPNYTGMITLTGGSSSGSSASATSGSGSTSAYVFSTASSSVPTPSGGVIGGSTNSTSTSVPVVGSNSTTATTAAPIGTGVVGTGASGSTATGTALHRNTTLSKATLTATSSASETSSTTESTSTSGSETSSGSAPSSSSKSGAVASAASNFALLCAAVVGVVYLG